MSELSKAEGAMRDDTGNTYHSTVKATLMVGGGTVAGLICGVIRSKVLAVQLGPAGIGLLGALQSVIEVLTMIFSVGIGTSAVRAIAEVSGREGIAGVSMVVALVRRLAWVLGLAAAMVMVLGAGTIGRWTFGADDHHVTLMLLVIPVTAGAFVMANGTILQGLHKMAYLTRLNVWGAIAGVAIGVPLIFAMGMRSIVWLLVVTSLAGLILSSLACRNLRLPKANITRGDIASRLKPLLGLGLLFSLNSIASSLTGWFAKVHLLRTNGLEAVGVFQAAVNIAGMYAGFVMQTMYMEYFPRIAAAPNRDVIVRSINEQLVITVLLVVPGVMATLVFAPLVIQVFYAASFLPAVNVLKWCIVGVTIRLVAWPMGLAIQAKGSAKWILVADVLSYITTVLVLFPACRRFGAVGAGLAMCAGALVYAVSAYLVTRHAHQYHSTVPVLRHILVGACFVAFSIVISSIFPAVTAMLISVPALILVSLYSLFSLAEIVPGGWISKLAVWFGFNFYGVLKSVIKRVWK